MILLGAGKYSGKITRQIEFSDVILSNTVYGSKKDSSDWHSHQNLHICLVFQSGRSQNRHSTTYTDRSGTIVFYRSEERHRWIANEPFTKSFNIEVGPAFLRTHNLSEERIANSIAHRADSRTLMLNLQSELAKLDIEEPTPCLSLMLELFAVERRAKPVVPPRWVVELSELLQDEWQHSLSLSELAQRLGVHPVTISKSFRRHFNCSLGDYRQRLKIEKSICLIKKTRRSLTDIAMHCGFADQSHFTRTFKAKTGFLPKEFRNS